MRKFIAVLAALSASASAFATTYFCDVLSDTHGHKILGGPSYAVQVEGDSVNLLITTGADEGRTPTTASVPMEKVSQEPDGATFSANGVTASIFTSPVGGRLVTSVQIGTGVGAAHVFASCR